MKIIKTTLILPILCFASVSQAQVIASLDFNDSPAVGVGEAADSQAFLNTADTVTGGINYSTDGTHAVWDNDATANSFKVRNFSTDITDAAYNSVTLEYVVSFSGTDTASKGLKAGFGLMNGTEKVAEVDMTQVTNVQFRPQYIVNNGGNTAYNPSSVGNTNFGLTVSSITVTVTVDFANDTINMWYNNADNSDGLVNFVQDVAYTGTTLTGLRVVGVVPGGTFGAGDFVKFDSVTLSGVAVPEPSTIALIAGMAALGFVVYRRRK